MSVIQLNQFIRPVPHQFRRPPSITIVNPIFEDTTPKPKRHPADPLKKVADIQRICNYLVEQQRYRDNLLFTAGINLGFRCGDLLQLKWGHLLYPDGSYRASVTLQEQKTDKHRTAYYCQAIWDAADLYLERLERDYGGVDLNSFIFMGESNRNTSNKPLTVYSVERILKSVINDELHIDINASTHCMRKTFGYHVVMTARDRTRAVELLQKIFGHSAPSITLAYIGITNEEIRSVYENLNLGLLNPAQCCGIDMAG